MPGRSLAAAAIASPRSRTSAIASAAVERLRRGERRELADGVPDDEVRLDAANADRLVDREARRHERRLLVLGLDELRHRRVEAELLEIDARRLAAVPEDLPRLGHGLDDLAPHPFLERALARKHECHLHCDLIPSVHSIRAEPHVRPAPMPVINTSAPGFSMPSRSASASASGIEPDDVFP